MLFYLDKELAKQGIAKCIAVSENIIDEAELEERKVYFQVKDVLIFEGKDIPHKFKYNESLNTIEEFVEVQKVAPRMLSQEAEKESDFDENVEIDPEKQYFYLDKDYADKYHKSQIIAVFQQPLKNPNEYFQKEVYCSFGKDIPYYITVENSIIREATEYEKYKRGQKKLEENEVVLETKKEIVTLIDGQYVENDEIITIPCPEEYITKNWNKETHLWEDLTTDYDRVQAQYREYEPMDTPSAVKEMEIQDPALSEEYVNMMIELRTLMYSLQEQKQTQRARTMSMTRKELILPQPSETLQMFKNRFESK